MTTLEINLFGNFDAFDDCNNKIFHVKREISWTSKISLSFSTKNKPLLKTHYYTLLPFFKTKIDYQNLNHVIFFEKNTIHIKGIGIVSFNQSYFTSIFNKNFGNLYFNGTKIAEITVKNKKKSKLIFEVNFNTNREELIFYSLILLAVENSDIDGE